MLRIGVAFIVTAVVFCVLDAIWLGFIALDFYRAQLGDLLLAQPNIPAAILFYVLYLIGVMQFVVLPSRVQPRRYAGLRGALFGLFTYMTYDLTNQATLRGWSWSVVGIDIVWGMFVTAVAALAGSAVLRKLERWRELVGAH